MTESEHAGRDSEHDGEPRDADTPDAATSPAPAPAGSGGGMRVHGRPRMDDGVDDDGDDDAVPFLRDLEVPARGTRPMVSDVNVDLDRGALGKLPDLPGPAGGTRPAVSDVNLDIDDDLDAAANQALDEEAADRAAADTVVVRPPSDSRTLMSLEDQAAWHREEGQRANRTLLHITPEAAWSEPAAGDETLMEIRTGGLFTPPRNRNTLLRAKGNDDADTDAASSAEKTGLSPTLPAASRLGDSVESGAIAPPLHLRTILRDGMPEFDPPGPRELALLHEVERMMPAARAAQREWAQVPMGRRLRITNRIRALLYRHRLQVVDAFDEHMAQTEIETVTVELLGAAEVVRDMVRAAPELIGPHQRWTCDARLYAGRSIEVRRAPLGVVGLAGSTTWPLAELVRTVAGCMIAGNALIVAPGVEAALADVLRELLSCDALGVPEGLVQYLPAGAESRFALAGSPVDHLILTEADAAVRRHVGFRAHALASVTFRLPASPGPMIVTADADLDAAARAAITSSHRMTGQVPESIGRVYIEEPAAEEFVQLAARAALDTRLGRMAGGFEVGPLGSTDELERAEALIRDAVEAGATIHSGGRPLQGVKAPYLHATVLGNCDDSMRVVWEHFAPILPVVPLVPEEFDELAIQSASRLPIQVASVFCGDRERAMRIAGRLTAGVVAINDEPRPFLDGRIPWPAGQGLGHGSVYGPEGLLELTRPLVITHDDGQLRFKPWWFPYSHVKVELARIMFRLRHAPGIFSRVLAWLRTVSPGTLRGVLSGKELESLREPRAGRKKK
ncbi:MAG: aldehyde dehydrogenase family protein [Planctomycetota bacterium]